MKIMLLLNKDISSCNSHNNSCVWITSFAECPVTFMGSQLILSPLSSCGLWTRCSFSAALSSWPVQYVAIKVSVSIWHIFISTNTPIQRDSLLPRGKWVSLKADQGVEGSQKTTQEVHCALSKWPRTDDDAEQRIPPPHWECPITLQSIIIRAEREVTSLPLLPHINRSESWSDSLYQT